MLLHMVVTLFVIMQTTEMNRRENEKLNLLSSCLSLKTYVIVDNRIEKIFSHFKYSQPLLLYVSGK